MSKHKQSIMFSAAALVWLTREAARLGISVSELVRRLVDNARQA